jgi:transcriptional regulator
MVQVWPSLRSHDLRLEGRRERVLYIPEHFRVRHHGDAVAFMRANPFAILISSAGSPDDNGPFATHLPLIIHESEGQDGTEGKIILRGHVAKANPHWQYLQREPRCLTIFHGPHAYVSPTNYVTHENVPTWNYGAVHAYGNARVFSEPNELLHVLHELIPMFEPAYAEQWASLTPAYRERMLSHIVGFEISVTKIEGKFKLSQNRTKEEQSNVMSSLGRSSDSVIAGVAELMQEQKLGVKKEQE